MVVSLRSCAALFVLLAAACDDADKTADVETTDGPLVDATSAPDSEVTLEDSSPSDTEEDVEILYPGNPCGVDEQCSTGLCYGLATPQGAFEAPRCQSICLKLEDFARYCDSDDDCCKGRCCIGCGSREGLCVND